MARTLSLNFREAINAQESGEVPIFLVTFTHAQLTTPIRLSTDPTTRLSDAPLLYATVSRGTNFYFVPMEVTLPDEREGSAPRSQIKISNITREVTELIRAITTPPKALLELVLASTPDSVEVSSPLLDVLASTTTATDLTLELALNSMQTELVPTDHFDPAGFPGLFG